MPALGGRKGEVAKACGTVAWQKMSTKVGYASMMGRFCMTIEALGNQDEAPMYSLNLSVDFLRFFEQRLWQMCEALDAGKPEEQCFQVWSRESCPCLSTPYKNSHGYPAQIHALVHANHDFY